METAGVMVSSGFMVKMLEVPEPEAVQEVHSGSDPAAEPTTSPQDPPEPGLPWWEFFGSRPKDAEISARVAAHIRVILERHQLSSRYCCLALLEPEDSINAFDLDEIYEGLTQSNAKRDKDVLLMLLSHGGVIEPAYQISKLCKAFARKKFVVVVPRQAKSAATLIAIGADEIHMSILGQLGPIDPQLGGLPALGVAQALERIAGLSQKFPGSADMFAKYLQQALTVEQIGYCDRIAQSAEQYAQRLLQAKKLEDERVSKIAKELVHDYKDHGFVIDLVEAREHLGASWVKDNTSEVACCEEIYALFSEVNSYLRFLKKKMLIIGELTDASDVFVWKRRDD